MLDGALTTIRQQQMSRLQHNHRELLDTPQQRYLSHTHLLDHGCTHSTASVFDQLEHC